MYGDTPKYDYEFQEWGKKVKERNVIIFVNPTPSLDQTVLKKKPSHNAGHGCLLKFQQAVTRVASYNGLIKGLCGVILLVLLFFFLFYGLAVYFYGVDFDGGLASTVSGEDELRSTHWLAVDLMDHVLV